MIFATAIAPILDSAAAVVMTGLEAIKGKWTVKITEYNYQISKMSDEPTSTRIVGFAAPTEEDDYEDD